MSKSFESILLINQNWLAGELRQLGYQVLSVGWNTPHLDLSFPDAPIAINDLLRLIQAGQQHSRWGKPDRIVYYDNSGLPWITGLEQCPIPKLFLSIDSHHHQDWHTSFGALFGAVATAHLDHLAGFSQVNSHSHWMPAWATRRPPADGPRTLDVCFRGTMDQKLHPRRAEFFRQLGSLVSIDAKPGPWFEAYPCAKIVLNQSVAADLNFRVFEAMISGALLITPRIDNGLGRLFVENQDLVLYEQDNAADAAEKIHYYLRHEDERAAIAASGFAKVGSLHSGINRAEQLETILSALTFGVVENVNYHSVIIYLFTAIARRELGLAPSSVLAGAAYSALARLLNDTQHPGTKFEDLPILSLQAASMLDAVGEPLKAESILRSSGEKMNNRLLKVALIDRLLQKGSANEAAVLAGTIGIPADNLESAIRALTREIYSSIKIDW